MPAQRGVVSECSNARQSLRFCWPALLLTILAIGTAPLPAAATVQSGDLCIEPDIEFPVPCEDEE